jgi:CDP-diacylglycerol--glycerol-3-phosphate 3-phosphatidyltransferase
MTTANKITIMRILLVPFFVVQVLYYFEGGAEFHRWLALAAFAVAAISDGIDGYIARRYNQRSELGSILDPLADKLLLVSGIVLLSLHREQYLPRLPLWLATTVISRDVLLVLGAVIIHYIGGHVTVRPHFTGKIATVLQMTCIVWALLKLGTDWLYVWAAGATACTGVSGVLYIWAGVRQLSASPASSPTPPTPSNPDRQETQRGPRS